MTDHPVSQRTIATPASVFGHGYWSGKSVRVEFRPASADDGITFVCEDRISPTRIPATIDYRVESPRRTTLSHAGERVEMVEHILAALAGLAVDNCEVWVNATEMPGVDGSSQPFVEALDQAGIVELDAPRRQLIIDQPVRIGDDDHWIEARPASDSFALSVRYELEYGADNPIGRQTVELGITPQSFRTELAKSRTFMLKHEADWLLEQGLGTHVSPQELLVFDDHGPVENTLRFDNECVRHKVLDLVGGLMLAGCDILGEITAYRAGHRLHAQLVQALLTNASTTRSWARSA